MLVPLRPEWMSLLRNSFLLLQMKTFPPKETDTPRVRRQPAGRLQAACSFIFTACTTDCTFTAWLYVVCITFNVELKLKLKFWSYFKKYFRTLETKKNSNIKQTFCCKSFLCTYFLKLLLDIKSNHDTESRAVRPLCLLQPWPLLSKPLFIFPSCIFNYKLLFLLVNLSSCMLVGFLN